MIQYSASHGYYTAETNKAKSNDEKSEQAPSRDYKTVICEIKDPRVELERDTLDQHNEITFEDQNPQTKQS